MMIAQLLTERSSLFDRKSIAADRSALGGLVISQWVERDGNWHDGNGVSLPPGEAARNIASAGTAVLHLYGQNLPLSFLKYNRLPLISSRPLPPRPWWAPRATRPPVLLVPFSGAESIPETIDPSFFAPLPRPRRQPMKQVGTLARPGAREMVELAVTRLYRFREDIEWLLFDPFPTAQEMSELDLWVDPAVDEDDLDGWTVEAMALGLPIIASRNLVNEDRLAGGKAGQLVPRHDPNELVHATLRALFKPESVAQLSDFASTHVQRFTPERRAEALTQLYARAIS